MRCEALEISLEFIGKFLCKQYLINRPQLQLKTYKIAPRLLYISLAGCLASFRMTVKIQYNKSWLSSLFLMKHLLTSWMFVRKFSAIRSVINLLTQSFLRWHISIRNQLKTLKYECNGEFGCSSLRLEGAL